MMGQTRHRREQFLYTAFSLDERIGPDNRLWLIRDRVDFSFARPAIAMAASGRAAIVYDGVVSQRDDVQDG